MKFSKLLMFLAIFSASAFLFSTAQQPCKDYIFSNKKQFSSCNDLPVLNSSLHWSYHQSSNASIVDIAFRHSGITSRRWIAWAINPTSGDMVGSQSLVAFQRTDGIMSVYTSPITSYGTQLQKGGLSFPVFDLSAAYLNDEMVIYASIQLPFNTTSINHIWQDGPLDGDTPMAHSLSPSSPNLKAFGRIDLLSGKITREVRTSTSSSTSARIKYVHGVLNVVGWGVMMPSGAIIARHFKSFDPLWFKLHISCQILGYVLGASGFGTGIFLGQKSVGIVHVVHMYIGIVLFALATVQVGGGMVRPKKDSNKRKYFNWFHYLAGYSTITLSMANIFEGFRILQGANVWRLIYIAVISTLGCTALILEGYKWLKVWRRKPDSTTVEQV